MEIKRSGSVPSRRAPASAFTGTVWQDPIIEAPAPALLKSNVVTFEPGARTHWHTHPMGQTLYVTYGTGRIQGWGGPIQEIRAGDVIWIPPGEKHWHGGGPTTTMTHISMQEGIDGVVVEWLEPVTDEQYAGS
ncbi:MAG: cupin domain-containing protein [Azospirillum sp.]|nr:cupin domain-containing protein [Azospirillum sp.]